MAGYFNFNNFPSLAKPNKASPQLSFFHSAMILVSLSISMFAFSISISISQVIYIDTSISSISMTALVRIASPESAPTVKILNIGTRMSEQTV